jgi:uncharacterized protein with von Willebrand factor type A (vWA) domain
VTDQIPGDEGVLGAPPLAEASDVAAVAARFGVQLHDAGVPVDPGRCERFARAVTLVRPRSQQELYACGLATLVSGPEQVEIYDRVFAAAFGMSLERAVLVSGAVMAAEPGPRGDAPPPAPARTATPGRPNALLGARPGEPGRQPAPEELGEDMPWRTLASDAERLAGRDFADLSAAELRQLEAMMRERALANPATADPPVPAAVRGQPPGSADDAAPGAPHRGRAGAARPPGAPAAVPAAGGAV